MIKCLLVFVTAFLSFSVYGQTSLPNAPVQTTTTPAFLQRGNEVEEAYKKYTARLEKAHASLREALKTDAPDLLKKITPDPPKPVAYGYQIVPKISPDPGDKATNEIPKASSNSYSWQRTSQFIEWELPKVAEVEEKLKVCQKLSIADRRPIYEKMINDYPGLEGNQRLIDSHLQYNRFWQKAIADDKPRFERLTWLHDAVLARQTLLDALKMERQGAGDNEKFRTTVLEALKPLFCCGRIEKDLRFDELLDKPIAVLEKEVSNYEKILAKRIHEQNENLNPANFIKVKHPKKNTWILQVPLYTDIRDKKFVEQFKKAIEKFWRVEDRDETYRMELEIRKLSPKQLYKTSPVAKDGEHLDLSKHTAFFPNDGGILTTGANSTFAIPSRYIALGPQEIGERVLAHEFGHILGFIDGYFRGFRDKGLDGYEVLEIIPDPDDIMCTPGQGHVRKHHYEKILKNLKPPQV